MKLRRIPLTILVCTLWAGSAAAGLFDDDEARKAILELRQKVEAVRIEADQKLVEQNRKAAEDSGLLKRSLLDLQNQIEALRGDLAKLRGDNEQSTKDAADMRRQLADLQRQQRDSAQGGLTMQSLDDRLKKFEPARVTVDGREFLAEPAEKRDFDVAMAIFRKSDFAAAQTNLVEFTKRYPQSGYGPSALFWLGNAQYATRDYKEAVVNFRALVASAPDHLRAPEAVLSIANCQVELKDTKGARKTLEDLIKAYPQSEAAVAAKDRLPRLK